MRNFLTLLTLLHLLGSTAWAGTPEFSDLQIERATQERVAARRGPGRTLSVSHDGLTVLYQEGRQGQPNWTQLTAGRQRLLDGEVELSVAPTLLSGANGASGVGAAVSLKLRGAGIEVHHSSHLGSLERHLTRAVLSVNDDLSLQAIHMVNGGKSVTRVGPAVKLTEGMNLWYGASTSGGSHAVLLTGNLRW